MRNLLILGSGRSGTSMVAGSLAKSGYFMGTNLVKPHNSNPKGFFEDREINRINEDIIAPLIPKKPRFLRRWFLKDRPGRRQFWLARIPLSATINTDNQEILDEIKNVTSNHPFCFKDPRFSYTLSVWQPYLENTVFVCVFRDPGSTAKSILKEVQSRQYLKSLSLKHDQALEIWYLMYRRILDNHTTQGEWVFIHYNQMLESRGRKRLEDFLQVKIDHDFPESNLRRTYSRQAIPQEYHQLYLQLCQRAEYNETQTTLQNLNFEAA